MPVAIQLAHAGRKGSSALPWEGGKLIPPSRGGWTTVAPSAIPHADGELAPRALDAAGLVEYATRLSPPRAAPIVAASTRSSCTWRMAICCTNSCRRSPIGAPMRTGAASQTGPASRSKSSTRCARCGARPAPRRAHIGDRLGARRVVARGIDRIRACVESAWLRLDRRFRRRCFTRSENPLADSRRPRAVCSRDPTRDRDCDDHRGSHHRTAARRCDRRSGRRRHGCACARDAARSAMAVAGGGRRRSAALLGADVPQYGRALTKDMAGIFAGFSVGQR